MSDTEWLTWWKGAAACGLRHRHASRGFPQAQLGPMIIRGTSTLVAGEAGHVVSGTGHVEFFVPEASNDD